MKSRLVELLYSLKECIVYIVLISDKSKNRKKIQSSSFEFAMTAD